jgi:hypothetical protein
MKALPLWECAFQGMFDLDPKAKPKPFFLPPGDLTHIVGRKQPQWARQRANVRKRERDTGKGV